MQDARVILDSGTRQNFETGAVRDIQAGKGRFDLLPGWALKRIAQHFEEGAKKYGDSNWKKGIPLRRYLDSAMRHLVAFSEGEQDEPHEVAAVWNILCLMQTKHYIDQGRLPKSLDDLWTENPVKMEQEQQQK